MGQRHQLFVIARVGKYYRPLAAVHHQWLYGASALRSCLRIMRIFSDPSNRLALKHELDLAAIFYKKEPPPPSNPEEYEEAERTICPFPIILTCLAVGAAYDVEEGRVQAIHELRYDTGYDQGDNNDGITVLDITDLDHVRYCFVNPGGADIYQDGPDGQISSEIHPFIMLHFWVAGFSNLEAPLTGREYLKGYYKDSNPLVQKHTHVIEALDESPLIDATTLARTWPWGHWSKEASVQAAEPLSEPKDGNPTKSLRDLAATKLFDRLLESTEDDFDPSLLDEVRNFPGFQKMVKDYLLCHAELVGPAQTSAYLLQLAYAGEDCLEWNLFTELDPKTIKAALAFDALKGATGISLTALHYGKPAELLEALSSLSHLRTLQVLDWPDRTDDNHSTQLFEALAKSKHHFALKKLTLTGLNAHGIRQDIWRRYKNRPKILEAYPVVQLLVSNGGNDSGFDNPSDPQLESFYLGDSAIIPERFITGLFQYLASQVLCSLSYNGTGLQCAHCFACGASTLGETKSVEIEPLPAEVYTIAKGSYHSSLYKGIPSKLRDLTPNGWTVIVSKTSNTQFGGDDSPTTTRMRFKYAFVRSKAEIKVDPDRWRGSDIQPDEIEVVDMEGFLGKSAPGIDTSKLAPHLSHLESCLEKATYGRHRVTTNDGEPLLSLLSPDETCALLKQFVAAVPEAQKVVTRSAKWEGGGELNFTLLPLERRADSF
ncbi:hypothetical protein ACHAPT_010918 [Fusarium lateritium]